MSSSLSASQLHTVNMRDPLHRVLGENPRPPPDDDTSPATNTQIDFSPLARSQPLPPHLLHPGLQDGRTPHPICAELHGGVRGVPGAGEPREHSAVHALYDGELRGRRAAAVRYRERLCLFGMAEDTFSED